MKPLTPDIAQEITYEACRIIRHGVLITDENGYVIGSSDQKRIGTLHEASLPVMKSRQPAHLDSKSCTAYAGTRAGVTFPIIISGGVVGTVGITGELEDVSQFGELIKMFVEVFIKDHLRKEMNEQKERGLYDLLTEIISCGSANGATETTILRHGRAYGYDLSLNRVVFAVEAIRPKGTMEIQDYRSIISMVFTNPQDFYVNLAPGKFAVFYSINQYFEISREQYMVSESVTALYNALSDAGYQVHIGVSSTAKGVHELGHAYLDAQEALQIHKLAGGSYGILHINQTNLERFVYNIPTEIYQSFFDANLKLLAQQKDADILMEVIKVWCECRFNATEASDSLYIHKNTLTYRLDRIKKLTGMDPRHYKDATALYLGTTLYQLKQKGVNVT